MAEDTNQVFLEVIDELVRAVVVYEKQWLTVPKVTQRQHFGRSGECRFNGCNIVDHRFSDTQRSQHVQNQDIIETCLS